MQRIPGTGSSVNLERIQPLTKRTRSPREDLFDRFAWIYALLRERIFQDDTEEIIQTLASFGLKLNGARVVELGCGPGFYATRIAKRFRLLNVTGVDRSIRLVEHGRARARLLGLNNCDFLRCDVRELSVETASVQAVISSRLFMMLDEREVALEEAYRVLRPGGLLFIAEPRSQRRAMIPVLIMRVLSQVMRSLGRMHPGEYGENIRVKVLETEGFDRLLQLYPWQRTVRWDTKHYQYAVCTKRIENDDRDFII